MVNINNETSLIFQNSANLVKSWGAAILPTGTILSESLTIQGISLWEIMAVELAMYKVPKAISYDAQLSSPLKIMRPYFGRAKQKIENFIKCRTSTKGCDIWPKEPAVLFLGFSQSFYFNVLAPIAHYVSKETGIKTIVLGDRHVKQTRDGKNQYLSHHWDTGVKTSLAGLKKEFKEITRKLYAQSALPAIICNQKRSIWPLMQDTFSWYFHQRIPQLLPQIAVAKHILEIHRPVLVISPDGADPRTRIYYWLCRTLNIPSLEVQFGLAGPDSVEYSFFMADRIAVFGEESRKIMLAYGVLDEQITITGSPRYDGLSCLTPNEKEKMKIRYGLPLEKRIILFAASYYMSGYPKVEAIGALMTEAFFAAADQLQGAYFIVKPHPVFSQQTKELRICAGTRRNIIFAHPSDNIQELISVCDAFVTLGSTSTLDAIMIKKLTITPSFPGWTANDQFVESGATLVPRSSEEIAQIFQLVSNGSGSEILEKLETARLRFLENFIFKADGQASQRICSLIKKMI